MTNSNPGKWVLVTGASEGIGEAFARRFANDGWNLILTARSEDKLRLIASELETKNKIKTLVIIADLSHSGSVRKIYEETKAKQIAVEGLVNNAGFGNNGLFAEVALERYLAMVDVMVRAVVELTHYYLKEMLFRRSGFVINVSSLAGFTPLPYGSIYSASKAFVTFFSEALWMETMGTGVKVVNLCPGITKTDFGLKAGHQDFHHVPLAQTPEAVVDTALKALKKNTPTVISGWFYLLITRIIRLVPKQLLMRILPWFQQRRVPVAKQEKKD